MLLKLSSPPFIFLILLFESVKFHMQFTCVTPYVCIVQHSSSGCLVNIEGMTMASYSFFCLINTELNIMLLTYF